MDGHLLLAQERHDRGETDAIIQPREEASERAACAGAGRRCGRPSGPEAHHDLRPTHVDVVGRQGLGWWAGDVAPVQVEVAVVARAPDVAEILPVLDRAVQVRAARRVCAQLAARGLHEEPRAGSRT